MEQRKMPPPRRGNIDGIQPRRPTGGVQQGPVSNSPAPQQPAPATATQTEQQRKEPGQKQAKPKRKRNLAVITIACVIFLGLSGLAVFSGLSGPSADNEGKIKQAEGQTSQQTATTSTTSADSAQIIDQTVSEIDKLTNKSDASGQGLSDEKLGL